MARPPDPTHEQIRCGTALCGALASACRCGLTPGRLPTSVFGSAACAGAAAKKVKLKTTPIAEIVRNISV
jgi:hypothetical protein